MKNMVSAIIAAAAVFIAWLQYNTDFESTAYVLLGLGIFGGVIVVALIILAAQRAANDAIIRHKEAEAHIEVERLRYQREATRQDTFIMRNAATLAKQQVRAMLPYYQARIEDKYRLPVEPVNAEFRPLEYGEEDL